MMQSESIGKLAEALSKAQAQMEAAEKNAVNPHYKSRYADLAAVIEAIKEPLSRYGLAYTQTIEKIDAMILLHTKLLHSSGEWILSSLPLILGKQDMQGLGSALTYARRYGLAAIVGISQDDDDGNTASARPPIAGSFDDSSSFFPPQQPRPPVQPKAPVVAPKVIGPQEQITPEMAHEIRMLAKSKGLDTAEKWHAISKKASTELTGSEYKAIKDMLDQMPTL